MEALQRELEEERRASHEQVEAFTEEKRVRLEEAEAAAARDRSKLEELIDKLKKTQDLLYDSTKDFLELRLQGSSARIGIFRLYTVYSRAVQ